MNLEHKITPKYTLLDAFLLGILVQTRNFGRYVYLFRESEKLNFFTDIPMSIACGYMCSFNEKYDRTNRISSKHVTF